MPQVNVLPVSVSQNIEVVDESSGYATPKNNDDFSQLIDQHLANSNDSNGPEKTEVSKTTNKTQAEKLEQEAVKPQDKSSKSDTEISDVTNKNNAKDNKVSVNDNEVTLAEQQKVATSGNKSQNVVANNTDDKALQESEQLMSFLYKADNTLLVNSNQATKTQALNHGQIGTEKNAPNEAQLLINGSNLVAELSEVAKALSTEQLEKELAHNITNKNQLMAAVPVSQVRSEPAAKQPVEPFIEGKSSTVTDKETVQGIMDDESAVLLKSKEGQKSADVSQLSSNIKVDKSIEKLASTEFNQNTVAKTNTSEKAAAEAVQSSNTSVSNVAKQQEPSTVAIDTAKTASGQDTPNKDAVSQFENAQSALNKKIAELSQANQTPKEQSKGANLQQPTPVKANPASDNRFDDTTSMNTKVKDRNLDFLANDENIRASMQQNNQEGEQKSKHVESKAVANSQIGMNQQTTNQQVTGQKGEQAIPQKVVEQTTNPNTPINTSTNEINKQLVSETQEQKVAQAVGKESEQEYLSSKPQSGESDELDVEEKPTKAVKSEHSINASFTDVSGRATQTVQQSSEQQLVEALNPSISTEVAQSQKTNGQLHQETIAIFRKDFSDAVKDKVMLMISQKLQRFDITLDPPELGSMQVRVNLQNEQASVSFMVQNQQAKEALEQNMHKLRDMLAQQGVDVGDANVEQQSQQSGNEEHASNANFQQEDISQASDLVEHTLSAKMLNSSSNAVDYYA